MVLWPDPAGLYVQNNWGPYCTLLAELYSFVYILYCYNTCQWSKKDCPPPKKNPPPYTGKHRNYRTLYHLKIGVIWMFLFDEMNSIPHNFHASFPIWLISFSNVLSHGTVWGHHSLAIHWMLKIYCPDHNGFSVFCTILELERTPEGQLVQRPANAVILPTALPGWDDSVLGRCLLSCGSGTQCLGKW